MLRGRCEFLDTLTIVCPSWLEEPFTAYHSPETKELDKKYSARELTQKVRARPYDWPAGAHGRGRDGLQTLLRMGENMNRFVAAEADLFGIVVGRDELRDLTETLGYIRLVDSEVGQLVVFTDHVLEEAQKLR